MARRIKSRKGVSYSEAVRRQLGIVVMVAVVFAEAAFLLGTPHRAARIQLDEPRVSDLLAQTIIPSPMVKVL
jgi:hypothetical protein